MVLFIILLVFNDWLLLIISMLFIVVMIFLLFPLFDVLLLLTTIILINSQYVIICMGLQHTNFWNVYVVYSSNVVLWIHFQPNVIQLQGVVHWFDKYLKSVARRFVIWLYRLPDSFDLMGIQIFIDLIWMQCYLIWYDLSQQKYDLGAPLVSTHVA
jgi:hypothetical protein